MENQSLSAAARELGKKGGAALAKKYPKGVRRPWSVKAGQASAKKRWGADSRKYEDEKGN